MEELNVFNVKTDGNENIHNFTLKDLSMLKCTTITSSGNHGKTGKSPKKSSMHGKIMECEKNLNNHGKIMDFCEII